MLPLPNRSLKKTVCIETTEKMVFLSGGLSALLEIWVLESFNCESSTTSQSLEEIFRVALPVILSSLNCLACDLPGSLRCNDEILFWDLYPILCFKKNCHILFKGGRVKYPENGDLKKKKKEREVNLWTGRSELVFAVDNTEFILRSSSISNVFAELLYLLEIFFSSRISCLK